METIKKLWGYETVVVNEPEYCKKRLVLFPGFSSSKHMHPIKKETFVVLSGSFTLDVWEHTGVVRRYEMKYDDLVTIPSGTWHRFFMAAGFNKVPAVFEEISMHHSDDDVVREYESYAL